MKKIVNIPLDERPCTYDYPRMIGSMATDLVVTTVPKELMGECKKPGKVEEIAQFLIKECKDADYAIIAMDTLLYGGIVPSRLHYDTEEILLKRLEVLKMIKKVNKKIKIFAYHLIMRCPSYSGNDEEPDYYALCGKEIHVSAYYNHIKEIRTLTEKEQNTLITCENFIKENHYEKYVEDYLARRKINALMNNHTIDLVKEGEIDFLVIPQDDSAPYGLTAKDQMVVRHHISSLHLDSKVLMYPDADAVTNSLLARAINECNGKKPKVFVRYSTCNNGNLIPNYEDRPVSESIKYQIMAAGGINISSESLADIVLMVNLPLSKMREARKLYDDLHDKIAPGEKTLDYSVGRNMVEYVEYIKYLVSIQKCVCVADIAYSNGSDTVLFDMLKNENLLFKVNGYAGWNTAANTLGTCIACSMINHLYGTSQAFLDFMGLRYLEDCGYQSNVRFEAFDKFKNEFKWGEIDGKTDGVVATYIRQGLTKWAKENLNDEYEVSILHHEQPWNRFFETSLIVKTTKKNSTTQN